MQQNWSHESKGLDFQPFLCQLVSDQPDNRRHKMPPPRPPAATLDKIEGKRLCDLIYSSNCTWILYADHIEHFGN
jgi:hypothetical protein